jgi:hypothetical protein
LLAEGRAIEALNFQLTTNINMENQTSINHETPPFGKQMLSFVPFFGIQVFVNNMACISNEWEQYRFPKTKKKRIRKKWSKRNVNFRMQEVHKVIILKSENKMYVSQKTFDKLKELP